MRLTVLLACLLVAWSARATSLFADDSTVLSILPGDAWDQVVLSDASHVDVLGGDVFGDFTALDASTADVFGGTLGGPIEVYDGGAVVLHGDGNPFTVDGVEQPYGTILDALSCPSCLLAGTLADGSALSVPVQVAYGGMLTWVGDPIPEPRTVFLLGLGLLGLAWGGRRKAWRLR